MLPAIGGYTVMHHASSVQYFATLLMLVVGLHILETRLLLYISRDSLYSID